LVGCVLHSHTTRASNGSELAEIKGHFRIQQWLS
jgi:hypothetical protein